jgi:cation transport regulator ChaC
MLTSKKLIKDMIMKQIKKVIIVSLFVALSSSPSLMAKETIASMELKLANLEVDISKNKVKLFQREEKLNEMKVKALDSNKVDKKAITIKLAEIESALVNDKLLLFKRELKLHEMKVALLKAKNR